jgi:hypothetical protein
MVLAEVAERLANAQPRLSTLNCQAMINHGVEVRDESFNEGFKPVAMQMQPPTVEELKSPATSFTQMHI